MNFSSCALIIFDHKCKIFICKEFLDLFFKNLFSQGISRIYLLLESAKDTEKELLSSYSSAECFPFFEKNEELENILPDNFLVIHGPYFQCNTIRRLTSHNPNINIVGIMYAELDKSSVLPIFDENKLPSLNISEKILSWVDAFFYSGYLLCQKKLFLDFYENFIEPDKITDEGLLVLKSFRPLEIGGRLLIKQERPFDLQKELKYLEMFSKEGKPCLFLDRDGIINLDTGYPHDISKVQLLPEIIPIIQWAKNKGWYVIVVTNQSGIARSIFTPNKYEGFTTHLRNWLKLHDAEVDAWYHCPYHPEGTAKLFTKNSICRKPLPGMLLKAMQKFKIDIASSIMIGDKDSDKIEISELSCLLISKKKTTKKILSFADHSSCLEYLKLSL